MPMIEVEITEQEERAIRAVLAQETPQEWIQHAIKNKTRKCIDRIIMRFTDKQSQKLSIADRNGIIDSISDEELDAEFHPPKEPEEFE